MYGVVHIVLKHLFPLGFPSGSWRQLLLENHMSFCIHACLHAAAGLFASCILLLHTCLLNPAHVLLQCCFLLCSRFRFCRLLLFAPLQVLPLLLRLRLRGGLRRFRWVRWVRGPYERSDVLTSIVMRKYTLVRGRELLTIHPPSSSPSASSAVIPESSTSS